MNRYNIARVALTIVTTIMVRASLSMNDIEVAINLLFAHILSIILIGIIEIITTKIEKEASDD